MLRWPQELVNDVGRMAAADQIVGELIEDRTERIGPESADVMGALKERLEHGCPPGKSLKSRGEHPDYAESCPLVANVVRGETADSSRARRSYSA